MPRRARYPDHSLRLSRNETCFHHCIRLASLFCIICRLPYRHPEAGKNFIYVSQNV
jgi:hypothetical protein